MDQMNQNAFLAKIAADRTLVSIYLKSGIRLNGTILGSDDTTVLLGCEIKQLIFKHAIATICPAE